MRVRELPTAVVTRPRFPPIPSMRSDVDAGRRTLGECPDCGSTIPASGLLIEYDTADGGAAMYAECPACRAVVHPA